MPDSRIDPELWILVHGGPESASGWPFWAQWHWFCAWGRRLRTIYRDRICEGWEGLFDPVQGTGAFDNASLTAAVQHRDVVRYVDRIRVCNETFPQSFIRWAEAMEYGLWNLQEGEAVDPVREAYSPGPRAFDVQAVLDDFLERLQSMESGNA